MSIQLGYEEDFNEGLKRLILAECQLAVDTLDNSRTIEQKHQAVHAIRKSFKKIRAAIRLVRDHIEGYKEKNDFFRDLGREVSDVRDAASTLESVNALKNQYSSKLYNNSFDRLLKDLQAYRDELAQQHFKVEDRLSSVQDKLGEVMKQIPHWHIAIEGFGTLKPSLKRVYKRGRKGYYHAMETGRVEDYHEWRKRIKYLRYQLDILNRIWPALMTAYEEEMHALTDFTGHLHDLSVLKKIMAKIEAGFGSTEEELLFKALLHQQEQLMRDHAHLKGNRFYFRSPGRFCHALQVYWQAHEEEAKAPLLPKPEQLEM